MDFQGPYPNGEYIFIMIDRYSRWPEMAWFRNAPNTNTTMAAMQRIFTNKVFQQCANRTMAHHFNVQRWNSLLKAVHITITTLPPEWPRANGTVERFNRSMKEALQAATLAGSSLIDASQRFLQMYRSIPHSATGVGPHAAMHGRR